MLFNEAILGLECAIVGPYGRGYFRGFRGRDIVLIAGGSGLSPMVSVARAIDAASGSRSGRRLPFSTVAVRPQTSQASNFYRACPATVTGLIMRRL